MLPEDLNNGSSNDDVSSPSADNVIPADLESPSTDSPPASTDSPEPSADSSDTPPINTIGDALELFEQEMQRGAPKPSPVVPPAVKAVRKFEGLTEDETRIFKNMNNDAYNYLYPLFLEHKKLKPSYEETQKKLKDAEAFHFYEAEGAWTLTPEYSELSQMTSRLGAEAAHWKEQLTAIEEGQPVRMLYKDKDTGQIYIGDPEEPTSQRKTEIVSALQRANMLEVDYSNRLTEYEKGFKEKHKGYIGQLQEIRNKVFQGVDMEKLSKASSTKLSMFPPYMQGKQEVRLLSESLVLIDGLIAMIRQLQSGKRTENLKSKTANNAGPAADSVQSGTPKAGRTVSDALEDFKRARLAGVA